MSEYVFHTDEAAEGESLDIPEEAIDVEVSYEQREEGADIVQREDGSMGPRLKQYAVVQYLVPVEDT